MSAVAANDARLLATNYTTTPTRTVNVGTYCSGGINRQNVVSAAAIAQADQYKAQLAAMTSINGSSLFANVLGGNLSTAITPFTSSPPILFFIFIGIFIIGFVVFQFIWPCLCCCCCCPSCCPSKCCQKDDNEQYTKCELYWPIVVLLLAAGLGIGASAYGFTQASSFADGTNSFVCSLSIFTDDVLNGNVTNNGSSFFTGLKTLVVSLNNISANINTINNSLTNLSAAPGTNMTNILSQVTTTLSNIDLISSGTSDTLLSLSYNTPLNAASPTVALSSNFPTVLGTKTGGGLVKGLYDAITGVKTTLNSIATGAQGFQSNSGTFSSGVTTATNTINGFIDLINSADSSFGAYTSLASTSSSLGTLVIQAFFGAIIGLCVLILLGAFIMCCCSKPNCRYLMYFMCIILFFITFISFLIATIFSVIVPALFLGCDFLTVGVSTAAGFNANFGTLINNATLAGYVTACLPSGSGDILAQMNVTALNSISNLGSTFTGIGSFNTSASTAQLATALSDVQSVIVAYGLSRNPDITDSATLTLLQNLATPSQYATCQSASTLFAADSWVPSASQNVSYVTCNAPSGTGTDVECSSSAIFNAGTSPCFGCMDTAKLLFGNGSAAAATAALAGRYTAGGCATFNTDLGNVWGNYYLVKKNAIGVTPAGATTGSGVLFRFNTAYTSVNTTIGLINTNITALFAATNNAVNVTLSAITDPKFGLVAGLNCLLFGEDILRVTNSICVNVFNTTYLLRLIIGIIAFALMFVHCCVVCSGVRFLKHSERKDRVQDGFPPFE